MIFFFVKKELPDVILIALTKKRNFNHCCVGILVFVGYSIFSAACREKVHILKQTKKSQKVYMNENREKQFFLHKRVFFEEENK